MANILYLSHRAPFPPNKGEKIRAYNQLLHLNERHRVTVGTFTESEEEEEGFRAFASRFAGSFSHRRTDMTSKLRMLGGLLTGQALSVSAFEDKHFQASCDALCESGDIDLIFVFSSVMAQYAMAPSLRGIPCIVDFVDVDSEKFAEYARRVSGPMKWVYGLEADRLRRFDRRAAQQSRASILVSEAERALFVDTIGLSEDRVFGVSNGVDADYFSPHAVDVTPVKNSIVFTGTMDYLPNVDAVTWFARSIFPMVREVVPDALFNIVGARPNREVLMLGTIPGINVTGPVEDIRPYYASATAVVAPMRVARGIQNKVLEGMSMSRPVIVSLQGLEGIEAQDGAQVLIAEDETAIAKQVIRVLMNDVDPEIGRNARQFILSKHTWPAQLSNLDDIIAREVI